MRFIALITLIAAVAAIWPALTMRHGWLRTLWRRLRIIAALYVLVIFASAVFRLVFGWDDIY
jgi:hypothetical protein